MQQLDLTLSTIPESNSIKFIHD